MKTIDADAVNNLMKWFDVHQRSMPWRGDTHPYRIWVSEIMLQQTQVKTVIPYYLRWMEHFPAIRHLAESDSDTVLRLWEGLGYYARAGNLLKGARFVMREFDGTFPRSESEALTIPGVGDYTAGAVLSIAYNLPVPAVDGNVIRVFSRLFALKRTPGMHKTIKTKMCECYSYYQPRWVNQAWMELGALQCVSRPVCSVCPLNGFCEAYTTNTVPDYPEKKTGKTCPVRRGRIYLLRQNEKYLLVKRPNTGLLPGLWELPNVLEDVCHVTEFENRHHIVSAVHIGTVTHAYSHFKVVFDVRTAELSKPWPESGQIDSAWVDSVWVEEQNLHRHAKPKVHIKALALYRAIQSAGRVTP